MVAMAWACSRLGCDLRSTRGPSRRASPWTRQRISWSEPSTRPACSLPAPKTPKPRVRRRCGASDGSWRASRGPNLWNAEIGVGPGADDSACPMGLAASGEQVIGALQRDEAARMARQAEDLARVLDADCVVGG